MRRWHKLHDLLQRRRLALDGRLSPESKFIGKITRMNSKPNWGMDRASVARKMPMAVEENR